MGLYRSRVTRIKQYQPVQRPLPGGEYNPQPLPASVSSNVTDLPSASKNNCPTENSAPIAVIGVAFRFPGDHSDEGAFWAALQDRHDLITQVPPERWATQELQHGKRSEPGRSITYSAGVLSRIEEFDAGFFGISPREAAWLDPQQRLLLELSWEALENAGVPASRLAGTDCSVYVGISGLDYGTRALDDLASLSAHTMTGNTLSVAANRISYVLDLHGPSLAVDTACSSSLVALHHACNSLRSGEASTALVGGVNLLLHPYPFVGFTKASMLCADGRCKPFDAAGNGYVRSEGGAMLLLKPLAQAQADGDEIHAVIRATGVNADGSRKTGITIPSRDGQIDLMRDVLAKSGLAADDVDFIEAHGTGTPVGDPIEAAAIGAVYGQGRSRPLPISSIKANLGHMEPASGMAGFVKALLALKNQSLPPTLHLKTPNPKIDFAGLNLQLVFDQHALPATPGKPLVAGVNSFGFGGANAHVLLEQYLPQAEADTAAPAVDGTLAPLRLSARSLPALRALAQRYAQLLQAQPQRYYDVAYAALFQRERLSHCLLLAPASVAEAVQTLQRFAQGEEAGSLPGLVQEDAPAFGGSIVFVYAGNGAQWVGMGQTLLQTSPRFAALVQELDAAMQPQAGFSLLEQLQADAVHSRLQDTAVAQPLLFAMQVAITRLLQEQGVQPAAVLGHSVGEIAAAWACGALTLEQAIAVICARSQAQNLTRGQGRMAAVGMSAAAAEEAIARLGAGADIEIAGINSPANVTLSGSLEDLQRLQALLAPQKVFFRLLDLDYAFHSHYMDGARDDLARRLQGLAPAQATQAQFISTVTGTALGGTELGADYWWLNVRQPVRFADAVTDAVARGGRVFVEISPHAILQRYVKESLDAVHAAGRVLPTLQRNSDSHQRLLDAGLKAVLLADAQVLQGHFPRPGQRIRLPNYPWQRERHWQPTTVENLQALQRRRVHPLLGWAIPDAVLTWENVLDPTILPWLRDHQVGGAIVFPGAAYAEMALAAARQWLGSGPCALQELDIISPLVFDEEHARSLRLVVQPRDGSFQIFSRQRLSSDAWSLHAAGRLLQATQQAPLARIAQMAAPAGATLQQVDHSRHYQLASALGLDYGPAFQGIDHAVVDTVSHCLHAQLQLDESLHSAAYVLHPAVLDLCFQALVDFFAQPIASGRGIALLPVKIGKLDVRSSAQAVSLRGHLRRFGTRSALADFELFDAQGQLVAVAQGCRFRAAHLKREEDAAIQQWRIAPWLQPNPAAMAQPVAGVADLATHLTHGDSSEERQRWFTETLPLLEALSLSFAFEACRQLQERQPADWQTTLAQTPYGQWLLNLLRSQDLLDGAALVADADLPPAQELWQALLRDAPACLPQLSLLGTAGAALPQLLAEPDARHPLHVQLQRSPIAESLYHTDPAYLGTRSLLQSLLQRLAAALPAGQRLRVLEISAGLSELPKTALHVLPADRLDYVLALPSEDLATRQAAEYEEDASVTVAHYAANDGELTVERSLPAQFDIVIVQHSLHRMFNPEAVLTKLQAKLAPGAILAVAERYPDWSVNLVQGLDGAWWRHDSQGQPVSSLQPPAVWQQSLANGGWQHTALIEEPAAQQLHEGAYLLLAQAPVQTADAPVAEPVTAQSWQLLADQGAAAAAQDLQQRLQSRGQNVLPAGATAVANHIVWMQGWQDSPEDSIATTTRLLELVQTVQQQEAPPRLWIVTRQGLRSPAQSALWGLGRVAMNECPQLACTLIDLDAAAPQSSLLAQLERELLQPDGQNEILLTESARHVLMLQEHAPAAATVQQVGKTQGEGARFKLDFLVPGQLRNLLWLPQEAAPLQAHEIEVRTQATGLNFRDVMYLMGLLPDEAVEKGFAGASLGLEFSGIVSRVGSGVTHLQAGDAVMGFGSSCFASHIVTRADAVAPMPQGWAFEAAATVPTVFLTVYYALKQLADVQPGERVLIHGAAGGVGIAAIQLARHMGAEIFATAGTDEKRTFVQLLGADHVLDSRSLEFAEDILRLTDGQGVDVVLNSLAGEAMRRSLDVLKPFGRFLELGKRDFFENTPVGLRPFKDNISYFGIDADQLLTGRPQLAARLFGEVIALFRESVLAPLPYRSFAADQVVDAFRLMQQARHIGKIVVTLAGATPQVQQQAQQPTAAQAMQLDGNTTWLVTGGLSGFGLASARWLAGHGVRHLALVGRRGADTPGAAALVEEFAAQGIQARAVACDITQPDAVHALVADLAQSMPPLAGVLHAAAQFDDRLLLNLDPASMDAVLRTKLAGAWNLHQATLGQPLTHFVLYSSVTTAIGNPGQANYVAANMGLEGLAAQRRSQGLPATCVGWGPIADAGYLTRNEAVKDALAQRLGKAPLTAQQALDQLQSIWAADAGHIIPANFDWPVLARLLPSAAKGSRFAQLNWRYQDANAAQDGLDIRSLLQGKTAAEAAAVIEELVAQQVAQILCIAPERITPHASLHDMGMDSLMAVELALGLEQRFGIQLPVMMLGDSPSVHKVSAKIADKLLGGGTEQGVSDNSAPSTMVGAVLTQHATDLTEQEVAELARDAAKLAETGTRFTS